MATIQDVIDYVQNTTYNTNINVLIPMINSLAPQVKVLFEDDCEFEEETSGFATIIDFDTTTIQNKNGVIINFNDTDYEMGYSGGQDPFWYYEDENIKLALWYDTEAEETIIMYDTPDAEAGTYPVKISEKSSSGGDLPEEITILEGEIDPDSHTLDIVYPDVGSLSYEQFVTFAQGLIEDGEILLLNIVGMGIKNINLLNDEVPYIIIDDDTKILFVPGTNDEISLEIVQDLYDIFTVTINQNGNIYTPSKSYDTIVNLCELLGHYPIIEYYSDQGLSYFDEDNNRFVCETEFHIIYINSDDTVTVIDRTNQEYTTTDWGENGLTITGAAASPAPYGGLVTIGDHFYFDGEFDIPAGNTVTITLPTLAGGSYSGVNNCYLLVDGDFIKLNYNSNTQTLTYTNTTNDTMLATIGGKFYVSSPITFTSNEQ